jgi:hypothetical protein
VSVAGREEFLAGMHVGVLGTAAGRSPSRSGTATSQAACCPGRRSRKTAVTESYAVVVPLNRGRGPDGKAVAPPLAGT